MSYIYILLVVVAIFIISIIIYTRGDYLTPSIVSLAGFFVALLCIAFNEEYWDVTYRENTFIIVLSGFLCIFLVDVFFCFLSKLKKTTIKEEYPEFFYISKKWYQIICVFMIIGFGWLLIEVYQKGTALGATGLQAIGFLKENENSLSVVGKLFYQVNNILLAVICFVVAYDMGAGTKGRKIAKTYLLALVVGFMTLILTGARSILFREVFLYVITCLVSVSQHNPKKKIKMKSLIRQAITPLALMTIIFYGLRAIVKASSKSASRGFLEYVTYYIGSPLYIFDKYVQNPFAIAEESEYFGAYTFAGFYNSLYRFGLVSDAVASFKYVYVGGDNYLGGNEYSFFMRPMHDFDIIGMLVFVVLLFSLFSYVYYFKIKKSDGTNNSYAVLLVYSYFFYIIGVSFFYPFVVQESKLMNIVYMLIVVYLFKRLVKRGDTS